MQEPSETAVAAAFERARAACRAAAERLAASGVPPEALAEFVRPRRGFLRRRPGTMRPIAEVWRIGPVLLAAGGELYALGHATRSAERGRPGYQSESLEERREIAAAALRGGYPVGTAVNYDADPLPLNPLHPEAASALPVPGPLGIADGEVRVRWSAGAPLSGAPALATFLADRVALLIDPPFSGE